MSTAAEERETTNHATWAVRANERTIFYFHHPVRAEPEGWRALSALAYCGDYDDCFSLKGFYDRNTNKCLAMQPTSRHASLGNELGGAAYYSEYKA